MNKAHFERLACMGRAMYKRMLAQLLHALAQINNAQAHRRQAGQRPQTCSRPICCTVSVCYMYDGFECVMRVHMLAC